MTKNVKSRWSSNGKQYRPKNNDGKRPFWNAINKYGWDKFKKEILVDNLTFDEAIEREIFYIAFFNSTNRQIGYNLSSGGNGGKVYLVHPRGMLGKHHTLENKTRQSEFMRNSNPMDKVKWGETHEHPRGMKGKKQTEHQKEVARSLKSASKKIVAVLPNGTIKEFDSLKTCSQYFDVHPSSSFIRNLIKNNEPYKLSPSANHNREKFKKLEGLTIKYVS